MRNLDTRNPSAVRPTGTLPWVRTALAAGVSAITLVASPAFAQDDQGASPTPADSAAGQDDEAIIVTGVRASLGRAMDIKRESSGVVDAISAEDIGKFPDTNIAESLQRIPGVSINRVNGEGSEVTVRGFGPTFNLVTLNGRQMPTSDVAVIGGDQNVDFGRATGRAFDFSNLASEGVRTLEVYKTGRAAIPSGGIGATINVLTQRPLDGGLDGLRGTIGVKGVYDTSVDFEDIQPEISGLLSWSDADDRIGISLFGSYQRRESASASATSNAWNIRRLSTFLAGGTFVNAATDIQNAPTDPDMLVSVPNDSRYHYSESTRERINGMLTLQFRPVETLTLTADALYARNQTSERRMDQTNWFNRPFGQVVFDDNPVVATTVFLQETLAGVKDIGFEQQFRATEDELQSYGFNAVWEATDTLTISIDGHHSTSSSDPNAPNGTTSTLVAIGAPVIAAHSVDYSGDIPVQRYTINDALRGNGNGVLDLGDIGSQVGRTNTQSQDHRINQLRADARWDFDDRAAFELGASYVDSRMTSARVQTQQTLGDWGITAPGDVQQFAPGLVEQFCLGCQFDHYEPGDSAVAFRGNAVDLYNALSAAYAGMGNPVNITGDDFDVVEEEIYAGYAQFSWRGDVVGVPARLVAGVRYEHTELESTALITVPQAIVWVSDNDFTRIASATVQPVSQSNEYDYLLPAIDLQIEPMDNLIARVSYSKTLARPDFGDLFASQTANTPPRPIALGGVATGVSSNPGLIPLVSENFDVSLEYYYAPTSYVSAGFFHKNVRNFVGTGVVNRDMFGLRDPSSGAAGSRSGAALAELQTLGVDLSDVNLFTMTALIIQNGGDVGAASAEFQANYSDAAGALDQGFVDAILAAVDIAPDSNDPLFIFAVQSRLNNQEGNIHGFELQGQHFFGNSGFGIAASYTMVNGDIGIDVGADPNEDQFALLGLSDSFNITGIYENHGISARVAYNWRDRYLAAVNRGADRNPVFVEPFGTLDVNISYNVTENIILSLEALNILGEPVRTHGRDESNLWLAQELHPRILFGGRYRF
jgi:TonB-dependent receptor